MFYINPAPSHSSYPLESSTLTHSEIVVVVVVGGGAQTVTLTFQGSLKGVFARDIGRFLQPHTQTDTQSNIVVMFYVIHETESIFNTVFLEKEVKRESYGLLL